MVFSNARGSQSTVKVECLQPRQLEIIKIVAEQPTNRVHPCTRRNEGSRCETANPVRISLQGHRYAI